MVPPPSFFFKEQPQPPRVPTGREQLFLVAQSHTRSRLTLCDKVMAITMKAKKKETFFALQLPFLMNRKPHNPTINREQSGHDNHQIWTF